MRKKSLKNFSLGTNELKKIRKDEEDQSQNNSTEIETNKSL